MNILRNCYLYKTNKVKKKNKKRLIKLKSGKGKIATSSRMELYAKQLNDNLPKSEMWFHELLKDANLPIQFDYNLPVGKYILDSVNLQFKIVIEIDGSFHDSEIQKYKDRIKDNYLIGRGYRVFRIQAYNMDSYSKVLTDIKYFLTLYPNNEAVAKLLKVKS